MNLRVVIADDQEIVRSGLRLILERHGIDVVGEAGDGVTAASVIRSTRPDVALVDIEMPKLTGIDVARAVAGPRVPDPIPVIIVTTFDIDAYVDAAFAAGVSGFILKDSGPALLVEAIRAAANGEALVSPAITLRLLRRIAREQPGKPAEHPLSVREVDIARAVASGRTNNEIAAMLFISLSTVKGHVASIQTKLGLRNRVELAVWAWRSGLIDPR